MSISTHRFPARGKVLRLEDGAVIFNPWNTNYELKLVHVPSAASASPAPVGELIEAMIRAQGRKVWTVPSGGNFVTPIQGPPRIVQGRIKFIDPQVMVVQAGTPVLVQLPPNDNQYDLSSGALAVGVLVNVTLLPGASFEWVPASPASIGSEAVAAATAAGPTAAGAPR